VIDAPHDANALRGAHFKRLMRSRLTQVLLGGFVLLAGGVAAAAVAPLFGLIVAVGAALIGLVVVFVIADKNAAQTFFEHYAADRALTLGGRDSLPPMTPLLRKGDDRYAERTLVGVIADGVPGQLALYTYEEETRDSKGNKHTSYYRYTLGLVEVPECAGFIPELYCQRKFGLRALEGLEDVFRRSKTRIELESEALDKRYEIFAGAEHDPIWLRRLFAPSFIVWMTDEAPEKFAFELVEGYLCCYVSGHKESAAELDTVAAATAAVARRLLDESAESRLTR
jgi:hypothetical protein